MNPVINEWFYNMGYTLHYHAGLRYWMVKNADETYILLFRTIEDVQDFVVKEGVVDHSVVIVVRDKREAP